MGGEGRGRQGVAGVAGMIGRCERAERGSYDHHGTRPSMGKQCIGRLHALVATSRNYGFRALARQDLIQVRLDRPPPGSFALFFAVWLSASLLSSQAAVSVLCDAPGFARRLESPLDRAYFDRVPSFGPPPLDYFSAFSVPALPPFAYSTLFL